MADYRLILSLLAQDYSYREIEAMAHCSHRAIAKARSVADTRRLSTKVDVEALSADDLDELFTDGRKSGDTDFVPIDVDAVVRARIGRKKPPLKVLWARYLNIPAPDSVDASLQVRTVLSDHRSTRPDPRSHQPHHTYPRTHDASRLGRDPHVVDRPDHSNHDESLYLRRDSSIFGNDLRLRVPR